MPKPAIPREEVHRHAEACSDSGDAFHTVASRLLRDQKPLVNFINENGAAMQGHNGQVALYMFSVILRVFEQVGGRLDKVPKREAQAAAERIRARLPELLPLDAGLPARVRAVEGRAQPHVLDEVIWALYEREDKKDGEIDVPADQSGLILLLLWSLVEALDAHWRPPRGYSGAA